MKSPNIVIRTAVLSCFILLMSGFVAYRTGLFGHVLDSEVALLAYSSPQSEGEYAADSSKRSSSDSTTKVVDSLARNRSGRQSSTQRKMMYEVNMAASSKTITGHVGSISSTIRDTQKIHTDSQVQHTRQTPTDSQRTYPDIIGSSKSAVGNPGIVILGLKNLTKEKDIIGVNEGSTDQDSIRNNRSERVRTAPPTISSSKSSAGVAINWLNKDTSKKDGVKKDTAATQKKR